MASSNTTEQSDSLVATENAATPPTPLMHPKLLMAASQGNHEQLLSLLNREDPEAASPDTVVEIDDDVASASSSDRALSPLLEGVTPDGGSALHVVVAAGSSDRHLRTARVIYDNARHLLGAPDRRGRTPLHCAARAGNAAMLSLLIDLLAAGGGEGGGGDGGDNRERVEALLRVRNGIGETALHEAIRAADKRAMEVLVTADPGLAGVPDNGTSPLYLAISLCRYDIARELHERSPQLSYSGPEGQNALHAAVLRSTGATYRF
ncbi:unnamed protein product [Urochloa humidicola]